MVVIHLTENRQISVCNHIMEDITDNIFHKKILETKLVNSETGEFSFLLIHKEIQAVTFILDHDNFNLLKLSDNLLKL